MSISLKNSYVKVGEQIRNRCVNRHQLFLQVTHSRKTTQVAWPVKRVQFLTAHLQVFYVQYTTTVHFSKIIEFLEVLFSSEDRPMASNKLLRHLIAISNKSIYHGF